MIVVSIVPELPDSRMISTENSLSVASVNEGFEV
jgi:hypothetical protein